MIITNIRVDIVKQVAVIGGEEACTRKNKDDCDKEGDNCVWDGITHSCTLNVTCSKKTQQECDENTDDYCVWNPSLQKCVIDPKCGHMKEAECKKVDINPCAWVTGSTGKGTCIHDECATKVQAHCTSGPGDICQWDEKSDQCLDKSMKTRKK